MSLNGAAVETVFHLTSKDASKDEREREKPKPMLPVCERMQSWRWGIVLITWFGFINQQLVNNAFTMAIVCMTDSEPRSEMHGNASGVLTTNSSSNSSKFVEKKTQEGEFAWDEATQGILLSASMYVSFLTPAISGFLARRFGPRKVVGITATCRSALFLLTPLCARTHLYLLIAVRTIGGSITNTLTPCAQGLWAHWAPDQEKVQIVAWSKSGVNIGVLLGSLISGFLCTIPLDNGWPFVFYVFGGLGAGWCLLWLILVYNSPEEHRWIKEREIQYIRDNVKAKPDKISKVPYRAILTSKPLFAYFVIQTVHKWCASIYIAYLPKYMRDVLRFEIKENAIVSSLPFASRFLGVIFWEHLADHLASRNVSTTANRKIVQSIGMGAREIFSRLHYQAKERFIVCAALTCGTGFISADNRNISVALFIINMFFQSCTFASVAVLPLDLSPRHAGIICGIFQSAGNIITMFGPMTVGFLTPESTLEQWRCVFYMITAVYIFGVAVFIMFGSAELQPWDSVSENSSGTGTKDAYKSQADETALPISSTIVIKQAPCQCTGRTPTPLVLKQIPCGLFSEDADGGNINASFEIDDIRSRGNINASFEIDDIRSRGNINASYVNDDGIPKIKSNASTMKQAELLRAKSDVFVISDNSMSRRTIHRAYVHDDSISARTMSVSCLIDDIGNSLPPEYFTSRQDPVIFYTNENNASGIIDVLTHDTTSETKAHSDAQRLRLVASFVNENVNILGNTRCTGDCQTNKRFRFIFCDDSDILRNHSNKKGMIVSKPAKCVGAKEEITRL